MIVRAMCFLFIVLTPAVAIPDVVKLKNGKSISCTVVGIEKGKLLVRLGDGRREDLRLTNVDTMRIGNGDQGGNGREAEELSVFDCEAGKHGFLPGLFRVESVRGSSLVVEYREGRPDGSGFRWVVGVLIRNVDTGGLISGSHVTAPQRMKCTGTEVLSNGQSVYVFEPMDPAQRALTKAKAP